MSEHPQNVRDPCTWSPEVIEPWAGKGKWLHKVNARRTNVRYGLITNTPVSSGVVVDIVVSHYLNCRESQIHG